MKIARSWIAGLAWMTALAAAPVASAQNGQTVASAHEFLRMVLVRGTAEFNVVDNRNTNWTRSYATIHRIESIGCSTTIYGAGLGPDGVRRTYSRRIDWSRVSSVGGRREIWVAGAVHATDGAVLDGVTVSTESDAIGVRIAAAMEFLRSNCDSTGGTGF
jgi:hypothetical protein